MARITIEDCMKRVPNRFQLVRMTAIRAKQLKRGAVPFLDKGSNKEVVTALREIAEGIVKPDMSEVPDIDPLFVTRGAATGVGTDDVEAQRADKAEADVSAPFPKRENEGIAPVSGLASKS